MSSDSERWLRGKRKIECSQDNNQGKRLCIDELAMISLSDSNARKRSLGAGNEEQQEERCSEEKDKQRVPLLSSCGRTVYIMLVNLQEWDDEFVVPQEVTTAQLNKGVTDKRNSQRPRVEETW